MTPAGSRRLGSWRAPLCAIVAVSVGVPLVAQEPREAVEPARFHHIHLNVTDTGRSVDFYRTTFGALPIEFRGVADALFTERSFILLNEVEEPPDGSQRSGIWHFGWGGVDLPSQYRWLVSRGVDIHTPIYRLGRGHVIYVNGPDREMIEVNTMGHHRFAHVHLFAADVNETASWYERHFGLPARRTAEGNPRPVGPDAEFGTWEEFHRDHRAWSNAFRADNVTFIVYNLPDYEPLAPWWPEDASPLLEVEPQRGRAIDHFALSYRDIEPVFERLKVSGVEIVEPITYRPELDMRSFFVMGPDKVAVEIVEAKPIPEGVWD